MFLCPESPADTAEVTGATGSGSTSPNQKLEEEEEEEFDWQTDQQLPQDEKEEV